MPFLAAMQPAVLYPVNVILELLGAPIDVLGDRAIAQVAVAMVGTFLLGRSLGLSRAACLMSALSFGLGLPFMVWIENPLTSVFCWLPWLLLCVDRAFRRGPQLSWQLLLAIVLQRDMHLRVR
jgi:hypothetical protein